MSTFSGKIQEIPNISVDRFDGINLNSEAYFLSHCHYDHMMGLYDSTFRDQLVANKKYLYASQISCTILKQMYPDIAQQLQVLSLNSPKTIQLKNNYFSVTLISAGHCPGSVMFLFENGKKVLYTGDYRINTRDIHKFESFYDAFGKIKVIDVLYLDTTFFSKKYPSFPKREESHEELINILKIWTEENTNLYVNLHTSARYGYEYVFKEIFKTTGMQIHVSSEAFKFYSLVPELDSIVTLDGTKTILHSHCGNKFGSICIYDENAEIKTIAMSAMRWSKDNEIKHKQEIHYICYSTHASYEEGVALINFLKPKNIEICVEYKNDPHMNKEIINLVKQHLNNQQGDHTKLEKSKEVPKLFNTKNKRKESQSSSSIQRIYSNDSVFEECLQSLEEKESNYLEMMESSSNEIGIDFNESEKTRTETLNDSVLHKLFFTEFENNVCVSVDDEKNVVDFSEEEDSVIYKIINSSPPTKRKK